MRMWDISVPVSPRLPVWPGDPEVVLERYMSLADGDVANISRFAASVHVGTHVDAPVHFVPEGAAVDELALDALVGPAVVVEARGAPEITPELLDGLDLAEGTRRLLVKTDNSELWASPDHAFRPDYVALTPEAARWVADRGIVLLGVDYLSVQRFGDAQPDTHRILLEAGVVVLEGTDLREVPPGRYVLACLPLKLRGSDGAPARAVLLEA